MPYPCYQEACLASRLTNPFTQVLPVPAARNSLHVAGVQHGARWNCSWTSLSMAWTCPLTVAVSVALWLSVVACLCSSSSLLIASLTRDDGPVFVRAHGGELPPLFPMHAHFDVGVLEAYELLCVAFACLKGMVHFFARPTMHSCLTTQLCLWHRGIRAFR